MDIILNWNEPINSEFIEKRGFLPNHPGSKLGLSVVELLDGDIVIDNLQGNNHTENVPKRKIENIDWNKE